MRYVPKRTIFSQLPSMVYKGAGGYEDDDGEVDAAANLDKRSRREVKQLLLRLIATEVHLHKTLRGECVAVQPEIQWFGAAIPHSSIMAVLEFVGVGKAWITFFKRVLEAQLNMESGSERGREGTGRMQSRRRGIQRHLH